jgi:hypothetical protein
MPLRSFLASLLVRRVAGLLNISSYKPTSNNRGVHADRAIMANLSSFLHFICFEFFKDRHHELLLNLFASMLSLPESWKNDKVFSPFTYNGLPFSVQPSDLSSQNSSSLHCSSSVYLAIFLFHTCILLLESLLSIPFDFRFTPLGISADIAMAKRWVRGFIIFCMIC